MYDLDVAESDLLITLAGAGVVLPLLMDTDLYPMLIAWRFDVDSEPFPEPAGGMIA